MRRLRSTWGRGSIEGRINGRIHNSRSAIIVSADPARNILRVRNKAVDTPCCRRIPPRQVRKHGPEQETPELSYLMRTEVGTELIPGVSHGRVAVADVSG